LIPPSSLAPLHVVLALVLANASPDESASQVVCEGALPFSRSELEGALRHRWHLLARPLDRPILVRENRDGTVSIDVGAGRREVGLQGESGEAAARVVALLAVDLLAGSATPSEPPADALAARSQSPAPAPGPALYSASAQLLVPFVANGLTPNPEPTVGLERRLFARAGVGMSAGFTWLGAGSGMSALRLREVPVRASVGYGGGWYDLRLSGVLRPYFVSGPQARQGVQWGGGVSATAYYRLTTHFALAVSGGVDALANRTEFRVENQSVLATHWLVPWLGAGLALRRMP
jgi:hypothetical protein